MSSSQIDQLVSEVQVAFDRRSTEIKPGLDVEDVSLLQLRYASPHQLATKQSPRSFLPITLSTTGRSTAYEYRERKR